MPSVAEIYLLKLMEPLNTRVNNIQRDIETLDDKIQKVNERLDAITMTVNSLVREGKSL